jgi:hypothetical protein
LGQEGVGGWDGSNGTGHAREALVLWLKSRDVGWFRVRLVAAVD